MVRLYLLRQRPVVLDRLVVHQVRQYVVLTFLLPLGELHWVLVVPLE